jgi:hypothetical protein
MLKATRDHVLLLVLFLVLFLTQALVRLRPIYAAGGDMDVAAWGEAMPE